MNVLLATLGLQCHVTPLFDYGIETLADLEVAVRMSAKDCAHVVDWTGITPHEWIAIRRALFTRNEWCQRSFLEDARFALDIMRACERNWLESIGRSRLSSA